MSYNNTEMLTGVTDEELLMLRLRFQYDKIYTEIDTYEQWKDTHKYYEVSNIDYSLDKITFDDKCYVVKVEYFRLCQSSTSKKDIVVYRGVRLSTPNFMLGILESIALENFVSVNLLLNYFFLNLRFPDSQDKRINWR